MNQTQIKKLFLEALGNRRGFYAVQDALETVRKNPDFSLPRFKDRRHTYEFYTQLLEKTSLSKHTAEIIAYAIDSKQELAESNVIAVLRALTRDAYDELPPIKRGRKTRGATTQLALSIDANVYNLLDETATATNTTKTKIVEDALKKHLREITKQ